MKKAFILALAVICVWTLSGCSLFPRSEVTAPTQNVTREIVVLPTEAVEKTEAAEETEAPTQAPFSISKEEIESEVDFIRGCYYTPTNADVRKTLEKGSNGWGYARDYCYHDGKLIFAFVFDGTEEHRLYFKDDHMFRYIDENGVTYDFPDSEAYLAWADKVLSEAYPASAAEGASASPWLGTWTASSGESLEIYAVSDSGLSLIFNKYSEIGNMMNVEYRMEFDNAEQTVASEIGGAEDHGGWEYTFVLGNGEITVKSRYPDRIFVKD